MNRKVSKLLRTCSLSIMDTDGSLSIVVNKKVLKALKKEYHEVKPTRSQLKMIALERMKQLNEHIKAMRNERIQERQDKET